MKLFKKIILILLSAISFANVFSGLPPETMIFMGNGTYKRAKNIKVGDCIPVYNIPTHQLEKEKIKIKEVSTRKAKDIVLIEMGDDKVIVGVNQKLCSISMKKFIPAKEFKVGDKLFSPEKGALTITKIVLVKLDDVVELYDIALEDGNLFLILTDKQTHILVHNFAFAIPIFTWVFGEGLTWIGWEALLAALGFAAVGHFSKDAIPGLEDILKDADPGRKTKGKSKQFEKPGDFDDALKDFDKLNPTDVKDKSDGEKKVKVGKLPGGKTVNVRNDSSDKRPTLDISKGKNHIKIRYGSK